MKVRIFSLIIFILFYNINCDFLIIPDPDVKILQQPVISDLMVYDDLLSAGWEDWSWDVIDNFNSSTVAYNGDTAISVQYSAAWGGLYLHCNILINRQDYKALQFWINGGATGGQKIIVVPVDTADNPIISNGIEITPEPGINIWTQVTIPFSSFVDTPFISGFVWHENSGGVQPVYYLDQIKLVK